MIKFIGNCADIIDWDAVIEQLKNQSPAYIGPRHKKDDPIEGVNKIAQDWEDAGYVYAAEGGSLGWGMYFPGRNFDGGIVDQFAEFAGIKPINTWISSLTPGMFAPWHWDANDHEEEYSKLDLVRMTCHISKPDPGHVLVVEDTTFYNQEQGNTYQWPSRTSWHAGSNFGYKPKYLLNIFGYKL